MAGAERGADEKAAVAAWSRRFPVLGKLRTAAAAAAVAGSAHVSPPSPAPSSRPLSPLLPRLLSPPLSGVSSALRLPTRRSWLALSAWLLSARNRGTGRGCERLCGGSFSFRLRTPLSFCCPGPGSAVGDKRF